MIYFTSDTHFGDKRLDLFHRDLIGLNTKQIDLLIYTNLSKLNPMDTLYHLGDVSLSEEGYGFIKRLNFKKILIKGNYDEKSDDSLLKEVFDEVYDELIINIDGIDFYLNHYPKNKKDDMFNLTGHIHGLWKVQRNSINVGCDAWHMQPISEKKILFTRNAILNHYDENVFLD
jgi:calcineurin-like phosphoesterase family protein